MPPRHVFPRHPRFRWFTSRGWAFGGSLIFGFAALWLRPPDLAIPWWVLAGGFASAAIALFGLGLRPEWVWLRLTAVACTVGFALVRSWALYLQDDAEWRYRFAAALIWMWIAWVSWLLAMLTARFATRQT